MPTKKAPAPEMQMSPDELAELRAAAAAVGQQDFMLGHVLDLLILHMGHAHGLDLATEDARLADEERQAARDEEDARLKTEAEALASKRVAEDAIERTPEQQVALASARASEDAQITADTEALAKKRAEEDALASGQPAAEGALHAS